MTGKRGRPTAEERDARRQRVLGVISRVLVDEGYAALSFDRVASEARVAKRTLYSDFECRAGMLRAAVRHHHAYLDAPPGAADDVLAAAIAVASSLLREEAIAFQRAVISAAPNHPQMASEFHASGPRAAQLFLAERMPHETADEREDAAEALLSLLLGEYHRRRLIGIAPAPTDEEIRTRAKRAVRLALGGSAAADRRQLIDAG
ncbi:TetR/AcrR family transcriptional regulator C-terminal domain-containing protein [Microbacterium oryzae]|uniref:TetR/AcrR family transcriptional regulator n=1 Tax=Microbacterium oryzae TaxID=743009 RepID=UPI0025B003FF|nr:TetR/AcrR family transcriptional regulator C-terminal domain-containing protein [Microbacterium oryzae]MDN3310948.1 TetR/AcrR family transcriptional regulator C-terminal domain-containing protein [Microbacterium oryzae]